MFYKCFRQFAVGIVDDVVNGAEMICGLDNIVHINSVTGNVDCVGLENITRLITRQLAAFDMV